MIVRNYWVRKILFLRPLCCFCGKHPASPGGKIPACLNCHLIVQAIGRWPGK